MSRSPDAHSIATWSAASASGNGSRRNIRATSKLSAGPMNAPSSSRWQPAGTGPEGLTMQSDGPEVPFFRVAAHMPAMLVQAVPTLGPTTIKRTWCKVASVMISPIRKRPSPTALAAACKAASGGLSAGTSCVSSKNAVAATFRSRSSVSAWRQVSSSGLPSTAICNAFSSCPSIRRSTSGVTLSAEELMD